MASNYEREMYLLERALARPEGERSAFLDRECLGEPALRQRLAALLAGHALLNSPLDSPAATWLESPDPVESHAEVVVGQTIGRYKILEQLGSGGCGVVYRAEQTEPVRREVALKVIKLGMDTKRVIARFLAERQAMAMMDDPHIAQLFDAGAMASGRPYFVMELVRGPRITDYCDQHNLPTKDRLELFVKVCRAIQHAHQKGIIHRDIKPSNILVTRHNGTPVPKVIDFGIAKAITGRLSDATDPTQSLQPIGTPAYMSPEQAAGAEVDTRSDIYSLGVVLYELLAGCPPFDPQELRDFGWEAMCRLIREREPEKPSTRLSRSSGETMTAKASRRSRPHSKLVRLLKGDLDCIAMKCLEKDPPRRYETANGLAMDVERYLGGGIVEASPPGRAYRMWKVMRRHRGAFMAGAAVFLALLLGGLGTAWQAHLVALENASHFEARRQANTVATFMRDILRAAGPNEAQGRDSAPYKQLLNEISKRIQRGELKSTPAYELGLRDTVGNIFIEWGLYEDAARMFEPALPLARAVFKSDHVAIATALNDLAWLCNSQGDPVRGEALNWEFLQMERRLNPQGSTNVGAALRGAAWFHLHRADLLPAEQFAQEAMQMHRRLGLRNDEQMARDMEELANVHHALGNLPLAETEYRASLKMFQGLYPRDQMDVAAALSDLGWVMRSRGRLDEAEAYCNQGLQMFLRLVPAGSTGAAETLHRLAMIQQDRGRFSESETILNQSVGMFRHANPYGSKRLATTLLDHANLLVSRGRLAAAEPIYAEALTLRARLLPPGNWLIADVQSRLGGALLAQKKFTQAEPLIQRGFAGLFAARALPGFPNELLVEACQRGRDLYKSWDAAEPSPKNRQELAKWQRSLEGLTPPGKTVSSKRP